MKQIHILSDAEAASLAKVTMAMVLCENGINCYMKSRTD